MKCERRAKECSSEGKTGSLPGSKRAAIFVPFVETESRLGVGEVEWENSADSSRENDGGPAY
jgi:hypothetical protein